MSYVIQPAGGLAPAGSASTPESSLGKDDFLRLLVAQLRYQDPLDPVADKEFMGQLAQFSALEQITNVAEGMERLTFSSQVAQSVGLIGRQVTYALPDGTIGSGTVSSVAVVDGGIRISVGNAEIAVDDVRSVSG